MTALSGSQNGKQYARGFQLHWRKTGMATDSQKLVVLLVKLAFDRMYMLRALAV